MAAPAHSLTGRKQSRREFLRNAALTAGAAASHRIGHAQSTPDYTLEIAEIDWELAPKKKVRTAAYNSQIPGPLIRLMEGKPAAIKIVNKLDHPEIVHWHGQWIPSDVDGSMEEGSPPNPCR